MFGLFGAALFTFATGNVLPSPLVWLAAAIAAAVMDRRPVRPDAKFWVPAGIAANCYLQVATLVRDAISGVPEFSPDDLKLLRFLLDRALRPLLRRKSSDALAWRLSQEN